MTWTAFAILAMFLISLVYSFTNFISGSKERPKIPRGSVDGTVNNLQQDKRRGKKDEVGEGEFLY